MCSLLSLCGCVAEVLHQMICRAWRDHRERSRHRILVGAALLMNMDGDPPLCLIGELGKVPFERECGFLLCLLLG